VSTGRVATIMVSRKRMGTDIYHRRVIRMMVITGRLISGRVSRGGVGREAERAERG
jgi:hypothetical protein